MKYDCTLSDTCFGVANAYILDMTRRADSISPLRMRIRARESGSVSAAPQDESKIHEIRAGKRAADIGCRQVQPRDRPSISIRRGCSQMQHLSSSMPSVTEERGALAIPMPYAMTCPPVIMTTFRTTMRPLWRVGESSWIYSGATQDAKPTPIPMRKRQPI